MGKFDQSIADFLKSGFKSTPLHPDHPGNQMSLEFARGLTLGTAKGGKEGLIHFVPSLLATVQGLGHGLWSFITDPITCSQELVSSSIACFDFLKNNSSTEVLTTLVPELNELITNHDQLSDMEKGELFGYIIGKYGIDIFIIAKSAKAVQLCKDLKKANRIFTLEMLSKDAKCSQAIQETASLINKKHVESIAKFRKGEGILKPFKGQYFTETKVRKILHQAGFETFPKPKGIPENYLIKLSDGAGGMKYAHPTNTHTYVRVMPGKPHSPNRLQQKPYVVQMKDGKTIDNLGNVVSQKAPESHIPLEEFIYKGE